jgi:hypothetical protein
VTASPPRGSDRPTTTIQLPPLSSPRRGPPQPNSIGARRRPPRGCGIHSSRGGYQEPVTSTSRRLLTPAYPRKSDNRILAKGQSSTDLIHTESQKRLGFQSPSLRRDPAVGHFPGWNRQTTVQPQVSDPASVNAFFAFSSARHQAR